MHCNAMQRLFTGGYALNHWPTREILKFHWLTQFLMDCAIHLLDSRIPLSTNKGFEHWIPLNSMKSPITLWLFNIAMENQNF